MHISCSIIDFLSAICLYIKRNIYNNLNVISHKTLNEYILIYKMFFMKNISNRAKKLRKAKISLYYKYVTHF